MVKSDLANEMILIHAPDGMGKSSLLRQAAIARAGYARPDSVFPNLTCEAGNFSSLNELRASLHFKQSKSQYTPGYEANSIVEDLAFQQFDPNGIPQPSDDLRLTPTSPAVEKGVQLPEDIRSKDTLAPTDPEVKPAIGCFPLNCCPLQVGVDICRSYPSADNHDTR